MKAVAKTFTRINLSLKESGSDVLQDALKFSKTIGKAVAAKKGLTGEAADDYAGQVQRTLRRVRVALENTEYVD
jgi:negative regulator of replication initiation